MNSNPASPKTLLRLLAYVGAVVLLACLMSPPLYWSGTWLADVGVLPIVQGFPFHRYFSRSIQISALLLLWPAFRWVGIRNLSVLGIERNTIWKHDLVAGFLLALAPVAVLSVGYLAFNIYGLRSEWAASGLTRIAGTAMAVSLLEEFLFRCVFLGLCLLAMGRLASVVCSSLFFAAVHFLKTSRAALEAPVTWTSGFEQLPLLLSGAPPWPLVGWGFLSLFVAGVLLAAVTIRTRSLFLAIGVHAGWILGQQGLQLISKFRVDPPQALLPWVGPNVVSGAVPTGVVPVAVLMMTGLLLWIYLNHAALARRSA